MLDNAIKQAKAEAKKVAADKAKEKLEEDQHIKCGVTHPTPNLGQI